MVCTAPTTYVYTHVMCARNYISIVRTSVTLVMSINDICVDKHSITPAKKAYVYSCLIIKFWLISSLYDMMSTTVVPGNNKITPIIL